MDINYFDQLLHILLTDLYVRKLTLQYILCLDLATCADVRTCSGSYGDGTYLLYPTPLGGQAIHVYCHGMATTPKAYITLHQENRSLNDFSIRTSSDPCQFSDRDGDAWAVFSKIGVNLQVRNSYYYTEANAHGFLVL